MNKAENEIMATMTAFEKIKLHYNNRKVDKINQQIEKVQNAKDKILARYNLTQYTHNDYLDTNLVDMQNYWHDRLQDERRDSGKIAFASAILIGASSVPLALVLDFNNVVRLMSLPIASSLCFGLLPALVAGVAYKRQCRQVKRVEQYLHGSYTPLNKRDDKIKQLQAKREQIQSIIQEQNTEQNALER